MDSQHTHRLLREPADECARCWTRIFHVAVFVVVFCPCCCKIHLWVSLRQNNKIRKRRFKVHAIFQARSSSLASLVGSSVDSEAWSWMIVSSLTLHSGRSYPGTREPPGSRTGTHPAEMGINNGVIIAVRPTVLLTTAIQSPGIAAVHHRVGYNLDFTVGLDLYLYLSGISFYINKYTIIYSMTWYYPYKCLKD